MDTVKIYDQNGALITVWQDVVAVDITGTMYPALVFRTGKMDKKTLGIQVMNPGWQARYETQQEITIQ